MGSLPEFKSSLRCENEMEEAEAPTRDLQRHSPQRQQLGPMPYFCSNKQGLLPCRNSLPCSAGDNPTQRRVELQ